jgi:glycosyltransferase involved in cell wall biosynthesis
MRRKLGLSRLDFAWVKVANLVDYKGHLDLVNAFYLLRSVETVRLFLVGRDRGYQHTLESAIASLGIADRICFLGDRSDVPEILTAMDGYVMASHTEGLSNAVLEAMATGLPVVATDVGGNSEALRGGEIGLLVEPRNPLALSDAMYRVMSDLELRLKLSSSAKQVVLGSYSAAAMVNSHISLYQMLLDI